MNGSIHIRKMIFCSLCCALTCVCAIFTIPIGPVPITLANLAVYISGAILGPIYGAISQILYILLVLMGLPFAAKCKSGPAVIFGQTGGYIFGYIAIAFIVGFIYKNFAQKQTSFFKNMSFNLVGCVLGTMVCYVLGTYWFICQNKMSFISALKICVLPFLIGDFLKMLVSSIIVPRICKVINL